jgi:hypothetical protein
MFEPVTFGPSGKNTNHYTTKATDSHMSITREQSTVFSYHCSWLIWKAGKQRNKTAPGKGHTHGTAAKYQFF